MTFILRKFNYIKTNQKFLFLVFGFVNFTFAYVNTVASYYFFSSHINLITLFFLINIVNITFSFTTLKYIVFKSKKSFFREYIASIFLYSCLAIFSTFVLFVLVDLLLFNIELSTLISLILSTIMSYYGNSKFTFK
jgi:hypothetical protein